MCVWGGREVVLNGLVRMECLGGDGRGRCSMLVVLQMLARMGELVRIRV